MKHFPLQEHMDFEIDSNSHGQLADELALSEIYKLKKEKFN